MEDRDFQEKVTCLKERIEEYAREDFALAFSGGVDSSILLKMCQEAASKFGSKVYGVTVHTSLHPPGDLAIARKVCKEAGAIHRVIYVDELAEAGIENNPPDRCYRCKKYLFSRIREEAGKWGVSRIIEGTNADDLHLYRPGIKALKELGIESPLALCGITKAEVRKLAAAYEISVADRPSTPCMATRFPYGSRLDAGAMKQLEEGERWLREQGFRNVRLRLHQDILRIEIDKESFSSLLERTEDLVRKMKEMGFCYITLDLEGFRSGSMDYFLYK